MFGGKVRHCSKITLHHDSSQPEIKSPKTTIRRVVSFHNRHLIESTTSYTGKVRSFLSEFLSAVLSVCRSLDQYLVNPANHVITEIERMAHGGMAELEDIARSVQSLSVMGEFT